VIAIILVHASIDCLSKAFVLREGLAGKIRQKGMPVSLFSTNDEIIGGEIQTNVNATTASSGAGEDDFFGSVARTGMKDLDDLEVGDMIVAKTDIPSLRIWCGSGYEITAMYLKGVNTETGLVETIPLQTFSTTTVETKSTKTISSGYTKYLEVYNPRHHQKGGPVIVSPEEIGLVTLKSELEEAMLLAIPGFFWVFVAAAFANTYTDRYGGDFWDAFFRT
jgi:hypothetical protein